MTRTCKHTEGVSTRLRPHSQELTINLWTECRQIMTIQGTTKSGTGILDSNTNLKYPTHNCSCEKKKLVMWRHVQGDDKCEIR